MQTKAVPEVTSRYIQRTGVVVLLALVCLTPACHRSPSQQERPKGGGVSASWQKLNVVVITIDTLRADRLGCYGNSDVETPNLDRLASRGVLFENAAAQTPLTPPSHASMFTGKYPHVHGVRGTGGFVLDASQTTLAEVLREKGWQTAAFVGAPVLKRMFGLNQGFETYDDRMPEPDPERTTLENPSLRAGEVVDRAVAWLERYSATAPFFLWVHVYDPHAPFDPPAPFKKRYEGRPYDGEVAYTDREMGRLFDAIGRKSSLDKTVMVLLSDHGESLGEHGEFSHGVFLYDATLRIPWLVAGPGVPVGRRVSNQVRTIDLFPTILGLVHGEVPKGCQGVDLEPTFRGRPVETALSYGETLYPKINMGWAELRSVRTPQWKYIRAPQPELYDLREDPGELKNLIHDHPEQAKQLEREIVELTATGAGKPPEQIKLKSMNQETERQLRSLGYAAGATSGGFELTGQGVDPKERVHILELIDEASTTLERMSSTQRMQLLRQALNEDSTNPLLYYFLGEAYEKTHRDGEALELYRTAISKNVANPGRIFVRMALIYGRTGRVEEGILSFEKAIHADPTDVETLNRLAVAYLMKGRSAEAERVLRAILVLNPESAQALNSLGWMTLRRKEVTTARQYFEQALQADPDFIEPHINLGMLCKQAGDYEGARRHFEGFLAKASLTRHKESIPRIKKELAMLQKSAEGSVR
ncbi:MAG: sulfatase-like hydrolase/transferase [Acidobacteriota bacterium]